MTDTISRREFFYCSVATVAAILASTACPPRLNPSNRFGNRLVAAFADDLKASRAVGHAYLRETLLEYDADILTEIILQRVTTGKQPFDVLSGNNLDSKLRELIIEDFKNENTVQVDGWILSETEAQLCALSTLL